MIYPIADFRSAGPADVRGGTWRSARDPIQRRVPLHRLHPSRPPRQLPNPGIPWAQRHDPRRLICRIPHRRGGEKEGSFQLDCLRPNHEHPV